MRTDVSTDIFVMWRPVSLLASILGGKVFFQRKIPEKDSVGVIIFLDGQFVGYFRTKSVGSQMFQDDGIRKFSSWFCAMMNSEESVETLN